jgi:ABC-type sugar transport system ATPase subunit
VHTGKWVVDKCLQGDLLRGRTILFVTHNLALTRSVAKKIVRIKDGIVTEEQSLESAIEHDPALRTELIKMENEVERTEESHEDLDASKETPQELAGKLVLAEEVAHGNVGFGAIMLYLGNLGGILFWVLRAITAFGKSGFYIYQPFFLGQWASQYEVHPPSEVPDKL